MTQSYEIEFADDYIEVDLDKPFDDPDDDWDRDDDYEEDEN